MWRMQNDGIGVQLVHAPDFLLVLGRLELIIRHSTKLPQSTRTSRSAAKRRRKNGKVTGFTVRHSEANRRRLFDHVISFHFRPIG